MLHDLRFDYPKNFLWGYLNINSLRNKIHDLRLIIHNVFIDYFKISETKLDNSFINAQFTINNYEIRTKRDTNKHVGGLIKFVRKGLICKRLRKYELIIIEVICSELTISNRNWVILSIYRPLDYFNLLLFFKELRKYLNQASKNYDNFIVLGDFNIDIRQTSTGSHKLDKFWGLFSLKNIIESNTCFNKFHSSAIGLFLTSKSNFFQKTNAIEAGLSDHHKLICIFLNSCYDKLKPKIAYYRNYKNFNEANFLNDLKNCDFSLKTDDLNENYDFLTNTFINILNKHAPLKTKFIRGNQAPWMTRNLSKEMYTSGRVRNKFCKHPTKENEKLYINNETYVLPLRGNL